MSPSLRESETSDEVVVRETEPAVSDYSLPDDWRSLEDDPALPAAAVAEAKAVGSGGVLRSVLYVVVVLVIGGAAFAAGRYTAPQTPAAVPIPVPPVTITISSTASGDAVVVDGREVGVTPYQLMVDNGVREVRLASPAPPVSAPQPIATSLSGAATPDPRPSRPRSGGLRVASAIELQVLEGERVLGSSVDGPIVASAGVHQLDFVNSAFGYRERRAVEFKAGQILPLTVTPPNGRLNINAAPWAQVTIDGREVGETPLANVSISVGQHEIVFRHPQLGERRETAIVRSGSVTRLSVTMAR